MWFQKLFVKYNGVLIGVYHLEMKLSEDYINPTLEL